MSVRPLTPARARALFPAARRMSYLNAAASSPIARPVERAAASHLRETALSGDRGFPRWLARKEQIRSAFARYIGAAAGEVAFTPSTSMGFNIVGSMLVDQGVREVLTLEQEFPSTTLPLLHQGLRLVVVRPRADGSYATEDLERALTRRTGAVAVSAVQYSSGFRLDLAAVGRLCRERKLVFAVNGAQALGQVPIDVASARIDYLCGTSHKWMMGGFGVGLFFARAALLARARLPFAGWLSARTPMQMDGFAGAQVRGRARAAPGRSFSAEGAAFRHDASALETGSGPWAPMLGFGAALELHEQLGIETIEAHNAGLQAVLRPRLRSLGFVPNAPDERSRASGICVFKPEGEARQVASALAGKGVLVTPRGGGIRVSTHVFNDEDDLERLFWALRKLGVRPGS
ncbi:MAG: aminotransferase class V-fold PLP-dependent enzyme [Myxococcaceae bacterium]